MARVAKTILIAALLLAGGCALDDAWPVHSAFRPEDGSAAMTKIFFVTDRKADIRAPGGFGSHWAGTPSCGTATLDIPAAPLSGTAGGQIRHTEVQDCTTGHILDAAAAQTAQLAQQKNCHNVLLFVHGFHSGFDSALLRGGQIATDTRYNCIASAFSWTSAVTLGHYNNDVERSFYAQPLLAAYIRALSDTGLTVDIIGHSMGARIALAALATEDYPRTEKHNSTPPVGELILAAPDIGAENGNDDFLRLATMAAPHIRRISIYASHHDAALRVSQSLHDDTARLGLRAADADYQAPGIDIIDTSAMPADVTGHNYYVMSWEVLADIARTLHGDSLTARMTDATATLSAPTDSGHPVPTGHRTPRLITRVLLGLAPLLP